MPDTLTVSVAAIVSMIVISALALIIWLAAVTNLSDLAGSDAAGNGLARAFGAIEIFILWMLLAILMIIAAVNNPIPWPAGIAALTLIPASCVAAMVALHLLSDPRQPPFLWPLIVPAIIPPLIIIFSLCVLIPAVRALIPVSVTAGIVWGTTLVLCLTVVPMLHVRDLARQQQTAKAEKYNADYARLAPDAPLWDWVAFLVTPSGVQQDEVLKRIRALDRRQSETEIMLERGDFPLGFLGRFDLEPTPAICDKARNLLARRVEPLVIKTANSKPYSDIAQPVADAVATMEWLVGYGCSCDAESREWETMAQSYRDSNYDVVRLAQLRDPKELGRILREQPAKFSMLTPQAHLKAWLSFAGDPALHDQALAGARALSHRTDDAVEMLNDNEYAAAAVMAYLPELDLEPTTPLCAGALKELDREYAQIYRPRADDPRPYSQLVERMGGGNPFADLLWLAAHGCDASAQLSEAQEIVASYQDSPRRAATLAELARARRKP